VVFYYLASTRLFWTIGIYGIRRDSSEEGRKLFSAADLRHVASPALAAVALSVVLKLSGIGLPKSVLQTLTAIAAKAYGSDDRFASIMITVTTACCIVVLPLHAALFGVWPGLVR
jgi:predicted permease